MTLPLQGIRVLDLTQALAGPFGSMILGDLGADVIKVEPPTGDLTRTTPPHYYKGNSVYFLSVNRNKRSVVIDLKQEKGRAVLYDLVRQSDVVYYNYSPGVAERLGIEHDTLAEVNPRVITCNVTGFGRKGPEANRKAVDVIVQALAGGMSITGEPGRPPVRAGVPTADLSAGLFSVIGILAALQSREATGRGSMVESSLFHAQLSLLTYVASYCLYSGEVPPPMGSGHLGTVPSQVFKTKDSYIAVDAGFNKFFASLCEALGVPELAKDPRFAERPGRNQYRHELLPVLAEAFEQRTTAEWVPVLDAHRIPCGPVNNVAEALDYPQSREYESVRELPYRGGHIQVLSTPIWFDGEMRHPMGSPPGLGEHTVQVLTEVLRYSEDQIAQLMAEGATGEGSESV